MCGMCPDFVEWCGTGNCYSPDAVRQKRRHFFLGDTFCEHLTEELGTDNASLYDHVRRDHYWEQEDREESYNDPLWCEDNCITAWEYSKEAIMAVVNKLRERDLS